MEALCIIRIRGDCMYMTMIQIPPPIADSSIVPGAVFGWTIWYVILYFGCFRSTDSKSSTRYRHPIIGILALSIWLIPVIFLLNYIDMELALWVSPFGAIIVLVLVASIADIVMSYRSYTRDT